MAKRTQYYCPFLTPSALPPLLSREFPRTPAGGRWRPPCQRGLAALADWGIPTGCAWPLIPGQPPHAKRGRAAALPRPSSSATRLRQSVGAGHARPSTLPLPPRILCIVGRGLDPSAGRWGRCPLHSLPPTSPPYHPTTKKSCPHQRRQDLIGLFIPPRITSDRSPQPRRTVPAAPAGSGSPSGR